MAAIDIPYSRFDPEFSTNQYNPRDALSLALASQAAYLKPGGASRHFRTWGFDHCESFSVARGRHIDTQGVIARNDDIILAAFRGSESKADWNANIQAGKATGPLVGGVHEGFLEAFQAAAYELGHSVARLRDNQQRIWLTGHSLGGALAVLLAATLLDASRQTTIPIDGLYTFGAPRVGDKRFAAAINAGIKGANFRVVNLEDIVPHLPPEMIFSHSGHRVLFDAEGARHNQRRKWVEAKGKIWGWIGRTIGSRRLIAKDAHSLKSDIGYLRRLIDDLAND